MPVITMNIKQQSIQSAMVQQGVIRQYRETAWYPMQGFDSLYAVLRSLLRLYRGYRAIGLCSGLLEDDIKSSELVSPRHIMGQNYVPLDKMLMDYGKVPVVWHHWVDAACFGEGSYGSGRAFTHSMYVRFSEGISSAILINKLPFLGATGYAGELDHTTLYPDGRFCEECGQRGCYQSYASTKELIRRAQLVNPDLRTGKDVAQAATGGNPGIDYTVDSWAKDVALGLANAVQFLNIDGVVLAGGIFNEDYILWKVRAALHDILLAQYQPLHVQRATLGDRAALKGIAEIAKNTLSEGR